MQPVHEISMANFSAVSEAITYAFARTAVRDAFNDAIKATGAFAWYDDRLGCFYHANLTFDEFWTEMRTNNCELSDTAASCILNALAEGTGSQLDRVGGKYAPAIWRHVKANIERIMQLHDHAITHDTVCGQIWYTACVLVDHQLDYLLPDETVESWESEMAGLPKTSSGELTTMTGQKHQC